MAKVTKKMLKSVVKECLVEILSEGLGDEGVIAESSSRVRKKKKASKSIFDQMDEAFERKPRASDNITFDNRAKQYAASATDDPVLQSILADTAKTTLQDQMQHESRIPTSAPIAGSPVSMPPAPGGGGSGIDLGNLFGEATKNWGEVLERSTPGPL